jgi:hypothetical protein
MGIEALTQAADGTRDVPLSDDDWRKLDEDLSVAGLSEA